MSRSRPIAPGLPTYWSWINGRVRSQVVIAEIQTGAVTRSATNETDDTTTLCVEKFLCVITPYAR